MRFVLTVYIWVRYARVDEQVQQMELEVRSLDAATRRELSKKVDQYKKSLVSLKADHSAIREKEEREGLFGDRDDLAVSCCEAVGSGREGRVL